MQESDLRSALLLEQAAHCFIKMRTPLIRKYAFHMILAGHRFNKAWQVTDCTFALSYFTDSCFLCDLYAALRKRKRSEQEPISTQLNGRKWKQLGCKEMKHVYQNSLCTGSQMDITREEDPRTDGDETWKKRYGTT